MSYRGALGQTKNIPGQVNFLDPWGSNPERRMNRAIRHGLPYAPYIEHGSWTTGQPDIVAWDLPEGAGLHRGYRGLGQLLTDFACSGSALNASWEARTRSTLGAAAQAAVAGGLLAGVVGGISKNPLIGAAAGAALAFGAFKVWTAPYVL
jgi:hypothetical protein